MVSLHVHFPILYSRRVSSRGFPSAADAAVAAVDVGFRPPASATPPVRIRGGVTGHDRFTVAVFGFVSGRVVGVGSAVAVGVGSPTVDEVAAAAAAAMGEVQPEETRGGVVPPSPRVLLLLKCLGLCMALMSMLLLLLRAHDLRVSSTTSLR